MDDAAETAAATSAGKSARERRSTSSTDASRLKAVRYEDALSGTPPVPVMSVGQHRPPTARETSSIRHNQPVNTVRPKTAPTSRASHLSNEPKRDSGIAASTTGTAGGRESYAESQLSSTPIAAQKVPNVPAIVVQDEDRPQTARNRSLFSRKRGKDEQATDQQDLGSPGIQRMRSFKGIQTDIPTGDLADLDSQKMGFTHRGSLLFGGKKMNEAIIAQGEEMSSRNETEANGEGAYEVDAPSASSPTSPVKDASSPRPGLVAGRRKPSVQMLQAAIQGGRVLSAEEISFSMKVRSMYQHGDEGAADWTAGGQVDKRGKDTPDSLAEDRDKRGVGDDNNNNDLAVGKTRQTNGGRHHRQTSEEIRASYYSRQPHEWAGGIEDWEDVNSADVDRYGFINPKRATTSSSATSQPSPRDGIHRVATGLQAYADEPRGHRRLQRGPSNARSSRSVPPSTEGRNGAGSVRSFQSNSSSTFRSHLFRSKDRRITDGAGDMLTLPPGLADIAEGQNAERAADALLRREWARNEKWLKMACPVRDGSNNAGGGMDFEFDTSDPRLVNRVWKGIPDRWRATAWHSFLSTSAKKRGNFASDSELRTRFHRLQDMNAADDYQIDVDVPRTISMHVMFRRRYRGGQRLLFRVLHAISLHFPDTGYVQGMASLAATLLCYFDEETAFIMMVRLWQLRGLEQLFQNGFEGLLNALKEFEEHWLGGGDVAQKLEELGITSTAYGTRWYLTLFNMSVPFPAQLRVWDVFMLLGDASPAGAGANFAGADLDVLHATSAALIDATREIILDSDFENVMKVLTSFVPIRDEDLLMRVARVEWKLRKKRVGG